jgi:hypothetical protein
MTAEERGKPALLNASRKRRIANGSGTTVQDLNKLLKQFTQMQKMMRQMKKMGMGGMMKAMKGMMGGNPQMDEMMDQMQGQLPPEEQATGGGLGPNPFLGAPNTTGGLPMGMPDLMGGGGRSKSSFTKSKKSKRKKK